MTTFVYVNRNLIPTTNPALFTVDRGFTLGDGLFETMQVADGHIYHLTAHLDRLATGATILHIPVDIVSLPQAISQTLKANHLQQGLATVRVTVSRGVAPRGLVPPDTPQPTVVIQTFPTHPYSPKLYKTGMKAIILNQRRNEFALTTNLKTLNYLENILGKHQAQLAGFDEGVFLNTQGFLAEGCLSNLFFIKANILYTPALPCGLVAGIVRQTILNLAQQHNLSVFEGAYLPTALLNSDEAFLTNTLLGVMPLTMIDNQPIGLGTPGPLTLYLQELYTTSLQVS